MEARRGRKEGNGTDRGNSSSEDEGVVGRPVVSDSGLLLGDENDGDCQRARENSERVGDWQREREGEGEAVGVKGVGG